ncbi:YiiX/YebB-like N1pC/P60 family cysteine hydrolase [Corynebacterium epidermidicanis]|uniref:LGFP repeat protein n=1 Tax=Corynebacterium epidermidicanis TaxID=1050174 RepID=A0A0G3GMI7_9CORY|nr:YiiX/YebB-like N1pC/P60 family cysteine hydrolase [Corynebacterium epidermidicanis]AKK02446.1 LGFP repeat protein [Corynebacterium epidermidicanis]
MNKNTVDNHELERALPADLGDPQPVITPGKMRSDRIPLPEGVTKQEADLAEVQEAREQGITAPGDQPMIRTFAADNCRTYWPSSFQVCGAIRAKYESMAVTWAGQTPVSFLGLPKSNELTNPDGVGKRTEFDNGFIYWHPDTGAWSVTTHNSIVWARNGWELGRLGYPTSDEIGTGDRVGRKQYFQRGRIYGSLSGVVSIEGKILEKWVETGEEKGPLGYPATDEEGTPDGVGRYNRFALGMIYWHPNHGAHPLLGTILLRWSSAGFERSNWGYPVADFTNDQYFRITQNFERGNIGGFLPPIHSLFSSVGISFNDYDSVYDLLVKDFQDHNLEVKESFIALSERANDSLRIHRQPLNANGSPEETLVTPYSTIYDNAAIPGLPCDSFIAPGNSRTNRGDVFYSKAVSKHVVNHGHAGIFVENPDGNPENIATVEAVNAEKGVQKLRGRDRIGVCNPRYLSVKTDDETRNRAAAWAESQVGSGYNNNFLTTRIGGLEKDQYNCSQLVWAAFKIASGGGLDIGERYPYEPYQPAVFPLDILLSHNTREFQ